MWRKTTALNGEKSLDNNNGSFFGQTLTFIGEITSNEDLVINGALEGNIRLTENDLKIGPKGHVKANLYVKTVIIEGCLQGDIFASEQVIIRKEGAVSGNIISPRVIVEDGAILKASVDMDKKNVEKYFPSSSIAIIDAEHNVTAKLESNVTVNFGKKILPETEWKNAERNS